MFREIQSHWETTENKIPKKVANLQEKEIIGRDDYETRGP